MQSLAFCFLVLAGMVCCSGAIGSEPEEFVIVIENHRFEPEELKVPAGVKFRLLIKNRDDTPEEFESYDFNREKIVPGGGQITVWVGPLNAGRYEFFGEFHQDTAKGRLVAEQKE